MFFWVSPRRQIVVYRRFGTLCQFHLQRLDVEMELTEGSETSENHNLTPGRYPKEHILHSGHGESLKSRKYTWTIESYYNVLQCCSTLSSCKVSTVNCVCLNFKSSTFEFYFDYFISKFQIYALRNTQRGRLLILNSYNTLHFYCIVWIIYFPSVLFICSRIWN